MVSARWVQPLKGRVAAIGLIVSAVLLGCATRPEAEARPRIEVTTPSIRSAMDAGLTWLAGIQYPDGHWSSAEYVGEVPDPLVTALALLAFEGAGHTEKKGRYAVNVRRAVAWLIKHAGPAPPIPMAA